MKNVLILAYDFPPYVSVGGLRPYSWYRHLKEFDIYPIVVTRQWNNKYGNHYDYISPGESSQSITDITENGTIIRTPYKPNFANRLMLKYGDSKFRLIRKLVSGYYEFMQWFLIVGPKKEIYNGAKEYLKKNKVDVIIATGDPFVLFRYASILGKEFNLPWIADYRDPWSQDVNIHSKIYKHWSLFIEKRTVKDAAMITTVSPFFEAKLSTLFHQKPIRIIYNGYDQEVIENAKHIQQTDKCLNIGFVGTIYKWNPIRSFLSVINDFVRTNPDAKIALNFYGLNIPVELQQMVTNEFPSIVKNVHIYPRLSNIDLIQKISVNNVMLLFHYYSIIGTKIYDYLGLKRVILLCYSNDEEGNKLKEKYYTFKEDDSSDSLQENIINITSSGHVVRDSKHLLILLNELYIELLKNGSIKCHTNNEQTYSRKSQTKLLAEIIHSEF